MVKLLLNNGADLDDKSTEGPVRVCLGRNYAVITRWKVIIRQLLTAPFYGGMPRSG
jgi:hypothetical protein